MNKKEVEKLNIFLDYMERILWDVARSQTINIREAIHEQTQVMKEILYTLQEIKEYTSKQNKKPDTDEKI